MMDKVIEFITNWTVIIGAVYAVTRYVVGQLEFHLTKPLEDKFNKLSASMDKFSEVVSGLKKNEELIKERMDRHNSRITQLEHQVGLEARDDKLD